MQRPQKYHSSNPPGVEMLKQNIAILVSVLLPSWYSPTAVDCVSDDNKWRVGYIRIPELGNNITESDIDTSQSSSHALDKRHSGQRAAAPTTFQDHENGSEAPSVDRSIARFWISMALICLGSLDFSTKSGWNKIRRRAPRVCTVNEYRVRLDSGLPNRHHEAVLRDWGRAKGTQQVLICISVLHMHEGP